MIATCNALAGWFLTIPIALATFWLGSTLFGDPGHEFTREPRFFAGVGAVSLAICVFLFATVNLALHLLQVRQTPLSLLVALVAFVAPYVVQTPYLWS